MKTASWLVALLAGIGSTLSLCLAAPPLNTGGDATLERVTSFPQSFHGKHVTIAGFATIQFEGDRLCPTKDTTDLQHCVWLKYDDGPYETDDDMKRWSAAEKTWSKLDGKRITVRGTFNALHRGHLGLFPGTIDHITSVQEAPDNPSN